MHPVILGELGRQRREGFDDEVDKDVLVEESRAFRERMKARARATASPSQHPSLAHLLTVLSHPHMPHRPAH